MKNQILLNIIFLFVLNFLFSQSSTPQPVLKATGNQIYCDGTKQKIATGFTITASSDGETGQPAIYIQISEGYAKDEDKLELQGNHPDIEANFENQYGKLTLKRKDGNDMLYSEIEAALLDIAFYSLNTVSVKKSFSITIGEADYLPSLDHYYLYVPFPTGTSKSWTQSKAEAETLDYYGRKGYLVTLRSAAEAKIAADQAPGQGWIGASDASQEGKWEWVTGPEDKIHFWNGNYVDGNGPCDNLNGDCKAVNNEYNNWANSEPNQWSSSTGLNEDYAHVYGNGTWNDYGNNNSSVVGYIVEFGRDSDDPLTITTFTTFDFPEIIDGSIIEDLSCDTGTVNLSAESNSVTGDPDNEVKIEWYNASTLGNLIAVTKSGENFSPTIDKTTDYYIQAVKYDSSGSRCDPGDVKRKIVTATIYPKPTLADPADLIFEQFDNTIFNLNSFKDEISTNQSNELFKFFDSNGNEIIEPELSSYSLKDLSISNTEEINVVVTDKASENITGCNEATTLTLKVGTCKIPTDLQYSFLELCETDNSLLGDNQDGIETFQSVQYFENIKDSLIAKNPLFAIAGSLITFHDSASAANDPSTAIDITTNYTTNNNDGFSQPSDGDNRWTQEIWLRVENSNIANCVDTKLVGNFYVNRKPQLKVNSYREELCNNNGYNLKKVEGEFIEYADNFNDTLEFTYYDSNLDEIVNNENYKSSGTASNPEKIYIDINTSYDCNLSTLIEFDLVVSDNSIPENFREDWVNDNIASLTKLESTNNPTGQTQTAAETFDSSVFTNIIDELKEIPEFQESGLVFYFYRSQNHMDNFQGSADPNIIYSSKDPVSSYTIDPQDEDSANDEEDGFRFNEAKQRWEQDIWLYVENKDLVIKRTECIGSAKVATLFVERKPIAYDVDVLKECDDAESGTEFDGIAGFDTTSIINTLITNPTTGVVDQDPGRFDIIFSYDKEGNDPITDFSSINFESTTQTIYVTMVNKFTETLDGSGNPTYGQSSTEIEFEVYKNPAYGQDIVEESGEYLYKQFVAFEGNDETDESLFNEGEAFFDLTGIEEKLIDQDQDVADFTFTFNPKPVDFTKYTATDTSEIEVTIYNNTYDTDPSVPYCEKKVIIDFTVLQRPDFDVDDSTPTIYVCLIQDEDENEYTDVDTKDDYPYLVPQSLEGKIGVIGTPTNNYPNNLEYTYSWEFQGETPTGGTAPPAQDLADTDSRIELDPKNKTTEQLKGRYFVTLTATYKSPDLNGTALTQTKTIKYIDVDVSQAPKMTLELKQTIVTIDDLNYQNRTNITIDDSNIESLIGIGNYEYQLEKNRTINGVQVIDILEPFSYQTEFRDKEPGIYTLRLRDKNGCNPEVTIPLYALGYMKYFTPNGDGVNDKWNIIGIDTGSPIQDQLYIFDRFGKLIRQINPAGTGISGFVEEGWDGTFNGKPMPQADYWFKVIVTEPGDEPKVFNGHFTLIRGLRRSIN